MGRNPAGAPWIPPDSRGLCDLNSSLTRSILAIWDRLNRMGQYAPQTSLLALLGGFSWFPSGEEWGFFGNWGSDGKVACAKFASQGTLLQLAKLLSSFGVLPFAAWRYLQMASFLHKLQPPLQSLDTLTVFESLCVNFPGSAHLLAQMYHLVLGLQNTGVPYYIRE